MTVHVLTACGGFLLAVLWMDLMFDSQIRGRRGDQLDEQTLASISAYYHRATTTSQPMGSLIAAVMLTALGALGLEAIRGHTPGPILVLSAILAGGPVLLALGRTVPNAVRLGRRTGTPAEQTRLARAVFADHVICLIGMLAFLVLWILPGLR